VQRGRRVRSERHVNVEVAAREQVLERGENRRLVALRERAAKQLFELRGRVCQIVMGVTKVNENKPVWKA
jgi:hypothetical protein